MREDDNVDNSVEIIVTRRVAVIMGENKSNHSIAIHDNARTMLHIVLD